MLKRLMPLFLLAMLAVPLAALAQSAGDSTTRTDAQVCVADSGQPDVGALTAADREAFQLAQTCSDPGLGDLRGGWVGVILVILLIVLIFAVAD